MKRTYPFFKDPAMNDLTFHFLLWGYLIAYCVHIVEESTVGGGFIAMMKRDYWPEYDGRKFFGFNAVLLTLLVVGLILFDLFNGGWLLWPLSFAFLFTTNGLWHLIQTIILREYSPGLITSPIYWVLLYFLIRSDRIVGIVSLGQWSLASLIGTFATLLMFGSTMALRPKFHHPKK
jgi:hypothetical protein